MKQIKYFVRFPRVTNTERKDFNFENLVALEGPYRHGVTFEIYLLHITDALSNVKIEILKKF